MLQKQGVGVRRGEMPFEGGLIGAWKQDIGIAFHAGTFKVKDQKSVLLLLRISERYKGPRRSPGKPEMLWIIGASEKKVCTGKPIISFR